MAEWIGASETELVGKWGYPETQNDVVKISDDIKVYSYRSFRRGIGGYAGCIISFTIKKGEVIYWKYRGGHCQKVSRYTKAQRRKMVKKGASEKKQQLEDNPSK